MIRKITSHLGKQSRTYIISAGLVLTAIIGTLDFWTGFEVSLSPWYLVPILLVAWYAGRSYGFIVAAVSAVVWLWADLAAGHIYQNPLVPYWKTVAIFGEFLVAAILADQLKQDFETKDRLVKELSEAMVNIKVLRGLIPICAWCKEIRDDSGYWQEIEAYLAERLPTACVRSAGKK